jgi:carboxyl-terminal processing protease
MPGRHNLAIREKAPQAQLQAQGGTCVLSTQKAQLRDYMRDWYYFNEQMPDPDPNNFTDIESYFYSLLYYVRDRSVASDQWSFVMDKGSYSSYFDDGADTGFGLQTTYPEDNPGLYLQIQNVDPASPAYAAGLRRGQNIANINGRSVIGMMGSDVNTAIYASNAGQLLSLDIWEAGAFKHFDVRAASYTMTLVQGVSVLTTPSGTQAGYFRLNAFVDSAWRDLMSALTRFKNSGAVDSLIIDLRYDRGGSLNLAAGLVNQVVGANQEGQVMTQVRFNNKQSKLNETVRFVAADFAGWRTVYVLTGPDTCSASEFVINTLKPYVNVVQIGATTCGKPFGFDPMVFDAPCDQKVFNAENFETFNANGEGRYYAGLTPTCDVADDLAHEPGTAQEALTGVALSYIDTGRCTIPGGTMMAAQSLRSSAPARTIRHVYPGFRNSMRWTSSR